MRKSYKSIYPILLLAFFSMLTYKSIAQLNYVSTMVLAGGNGQSGVTFNVKAKNTITVAEIWCSFGAGAQTVTVWYHPTDSVNGAPVVSTATGWVQLWTGTMTPAVGGYGTMDKIPIPSLSLTLAGNKVYGFHISSSGTVNYTGTASNTQPATPLFEDANMYIYTGLNVGYGGNPPSASFHVRQFNGQIGYIGCQTPTGLAVNGITETTANAIWNAVPGSIGYEYAVTNSSTPPASGTATTSTGFNATGLNANTTYYIHVRNKCSATSFSTWTTQSFMTLNSCYTPTNVTITPTSSSSVDISWNSPAVSTGFEYVINGSPTPPATSGTTTTNTSISVNALTPNTTYYLHIRNVCSSVSKSDWSTKMFLTPQCSAPASIDIINIGANTADIVWNMTSAAREYEYILSTVKSTPTSGKNALKTTGFITNVTALTPSTEYYVYVRSRCFATDSSAWVVDSFITNGECPAPDLKVQKIDENNLNITWTANNNDYAYEYAIKDSRINPVNGIEQFDNTLSAQLPLDNKAYYLHVRRKCDQGTNLSAWSSITLRGVDPTKVEYLTSMPKIRIYPNPASNILKIEVDGIIVKESKIIITDILGSEVMEAKIKMSKEELNINSLAPGTYFIKYEDDNTRDLQKFIKL
jgi:hypothetical protein